MADAVRGMRVGVFGLGAIGGSLARDLTKAGYAVTGFDSDPATAAEAFDSGAVGALADTGEALAGSGELLVYAVPFGGLVQILDVHVKLWKPEAVATDVGSLKAPIMNLARERGVGDRFVGSHPMAGSERSGFAASRAGMFQDVQVWLTDVGASRRARKAVEDLWECVGSRVEWISPESHDRQVVWASHLPQLLATTLARVMDSQDILPRHLGRGGLDMTRLAGSSPEMWIPILKAETAAASTALRAFAVEAEQLADRLTAGDEEGVADLFRRASLWRSNG